MPVGGGMVLHDSIVLINDGSGHFPARVELPPPPFYRGYTAVEAIVSMNAARASGSIDSDINDDGYQDLVLMHTRNDDVASEPNPEEVAWTGRYVQVLVNRGDADDVSFTDETRTRLVQGPTRGTRFPDGEPLVNGARRLSMRDLDRDGCPELVLGNAGGPITKQSPIAYRNNGRGQFRPMHPEPFWRHPRPRERHFGYGAHPADVNGDGLVDVVVPVGLWGSDNRPNTRDDYTLLTTVLNTTRPRPTRC